MNDTLKQLKASLKDALEKEYYEPGSLDEILGDRYHFEDINNSHLVLRNSEKIGYVQGYNKR